MTRAEAMLWSEIKEKKILGYKFRRQFGIGAYVVDFYCPALKLAIEVDGITHSTDDEKEYDTMRESERTIRHSIPSFHKPRNLR